MCAWDSVREYCDFKDISTDISVLILTSSIISIIAVPLNRLVTYLAARLPRASAIFSALSVPLSAFSIKFSSKSITGRVYAITEDAAPTPEDHISSNGSLKKKTKPKPPSEPSKHRSRILYPGNEENPSNKIMSYDSASDTGTYNGANRLKSSARSQSLWGTRRKSDEAGNQISGKFPVVSDQYNQSLAASLHEHDHIDAFSFDEISAWQNRSSKLVRAALLHSLRAKTDLCAPDIEMEALQSCLTKRSQSLGGSIASERSGTNRTLFGNYSGLNETFGKIALKNLIAARKNRATEIQQHMNALEKAGLEECLLRYYIIHSSEFSISQMLLRCFLFYRYIFDLSILEALTLTLTLTHLIANTSLITLNHLH